MEGFFLVVSEVLRFCPDEIASLGDRVAVDKLAILKSAET